MATLVEWPEFIALAVHQSLYFVSYCNFSSTASLFYPWVIFVDVHLYYYPNLSLHRFLFVKMAQKSLNV